MPKIVIVGSCRFEPYMILASPNKLDKKVYETDHEKAYNMSTKIFYPAMDVCDEVWVYAPDGIGDHTMQDLEYAKRQGKKILMLVPLKDVFDRVHEK